MSLSLLALLLLFSGPTSSSSPHGDDAGWPCDIPARPLAAPVTFWPGVARPSVADWSAHPGIMTLAQRASRREIEEADAVSNVRQFVASRPDADDRARLAAAIIDSIDRERRTILDGIRRFNARQAQLAKQIENGYDALDAEALSVERQDALQEQVTWDQRIFEDRQRLLPIICRQPAMLENRLQSLLAALKS